jgi:hypothetical protein
MAQWYCSFIESVAFKGSYLSIDIGASLRRANIDKLR